MEPHRDSAFLIFDANMPRMEECKKDGSCVHDDKILCRHRFKFCSLIHYFNTKELQGYSDLKIILYFLASFTANTIFASIKDTHRIIILTKDRKFINEVRGDWNGVKNSNKHISLEFDELTIRETNSGITFSVHQVSVKASGANRKTNRESVIESLNAVFTAP